MRGATDIFIFTGIMDASFYVENILAILGKTEPNRKYVAGA